MLNFFVSFLIVVCLLWLSVSGSKTHPNNKYLTNKFNIVVLLTVSLKIHFCVYHELVESF